MTTWTGRTPAWEMARATERLAAAVRAAEEHAAALPGGVGPWPAPRSLEEAQERRERAAAVIAKINAQYEVFRPTETVDWQTWESYDRWRQRAKGMVKRAELELAKVKEWQATSLTAKGLRRTPADLAHWRDRAREALEVLHAIREHAEAEGGRRGQVRWC